MKQVKLKQVCKILNGFAFKSEEYKEEGAPLLRISNFDDGDVVVNDKSIYVDKSFLKIKKDFIVEKGDILIALSGATTGKYGIYNYDFPSLLNQRIGLIKSSASNDLYGKYFYYYLNILKAEILRKAGGAAQPNISTKTIGELQIPIPPLPLQQKIANILDAADALRQNNKALVAKYDELTQALFLDMFGDPVSNPKGWENKTVLELTNKVTDGTHFTPKYTSEGIPFLRVTDITESNDSKKFISEDEHKELIKRCHPEKGDILYTKNGTIGVGKIVNWDYDFSIFVSLCLLKPKHELINVIYFNYFLNTPFALRQAMSHSKVATIKNLHLVEIKKMKIPLPPISLQNQFAERIALIEEQKAIAQKCLEKSEALFNSLLQKAFKGELL